VKSRKVFWWQNVGFCSSTFKLGCDQWCYSLTLALALTFRPWDCGLGHRNSRPKSWRTTKFTFNFRRLDWIIFQDSRSLFTSTYRHNKLGKIRRCRLENSVAQHRSDLAELRPLFDVFSIHQLVRPVLSAFLQNGLLEWVTLLELEYNVALYRKLS